jgi:hypothetical protein
MAVEEDLSLALLLWDAGEQPRRRTAGKGGGGETLAGVRACACARLDAMERRGGRR